jgi:hypothetical protein
LVFGFRLRQGYGGQVVPAQSQGYFKPAPSPEPRQKPKIPAAHHYIFYGDALMIACPKLDSAGKAKHLTDSEASLQSPQSVRNSRNHIRILLGILRKFVGKEKNGIQYLIRHTYAWLRILE